MSASNWSAKQYTIYERERTRPVRDLLAGVPGHEVQKAVDIGCGPGNSTEVLALWFPDAAIEAFDPDADMIAAARKRLPSVTFAQNGVEDWAGAGPYDVILANAVLQWVPDHASLLPNLLNKLAPGGSLAIQMPDNADEPTHRLMRTVAETGPWAAKLAKIAQPARENADWYYRLLKAQGVRVEIWRTAYYHALAGGVDGIVEWFGGSSLRPLLAALDDSEKTAFLDRYRAGLSKAYPAMADGSILFALPRLFIVATKEG